MFGRAMNQDAIEIIRIHFFAETVEMLHRIEARIVFDPSHFGLNIKLLARQALDGSIHIFVRFVLIGGVNVTNSVIEAVMHQLRKSILP